MSLPINPNRVDILDAGVVVTGKSKEVEALREV